MNNLNASAIEVVYNKSSYTNSYVYGVNYESEDVRRIILDFLSVLLVFLGCNDTNHKIKSIRYQLISGSCAFAIGRCVVDADVLPQSGFSNELWCPTDFSSNLLVFKFTSCDSVQKIHHNMSSGVSGALDCGVGSLMVTLLITRLSLFLVNSSLMDSKQRTIFSWATMIWFTSLKGACITTNRTLVC